MFFLLGGVGVAVVVAPAGHVFHGRERHAVVRARAVLVNSRRAGSSTHSFIRDCLVLEYPGTQLMSVVHVCHSCIRRSDLKQAHFNTEAHTWSIRSDRHWWREAPFSRKQRESRRRRMLKKKLWGEEWKSLCVGGVGRRRPFEAPAQERLHRGGAKLLATLRGVSRLSRAPSITVRDTRASVHTATSHAAAAALSARAASFKPPLASNVCTVYIS